MEAKTIKIGGKTGESGVIVIEESDIVAGANSHEFFLELEAGSFAYFAPCQRYALNKQYETESPFPDGFNQLQCSVVDDFTKIRPGGMLMTTRLESGAYLALLPITTTNAMSYFDQRDGQLVLRIETFGKECVAFAQSALAWCVDDNLYRSIEKTWELALASNGVAYSSRKRTLKHFPEVFNYLGYCTWEEFKDEINEDVLVDTLQKLEASDLPVRYFLVDDGHDLPAEDGKKMIASFRPDAKKFPSAFAPLMKYKNPERIRWFGLWRCFSGWWEGISKENSFGSLNQHLMPVNKGALQPADDEYSSRIFYESFMKQVHEDGFDFVKIDVQATNITFYQGLRNAVESACRNSQSLEAACAKFNLALINCMAHNPACVFNTRFSAVTRCSEDYKANDLWRAKLHIYNSYQNTLLLGHTVWPDHDMVHSNDTVCAQMLSISKALSGGPVYLSDHPDNFNKEHILPLCFKDGEILRPLAPAVPLPDCALGEPFDRAEPYMVIAPLPGDCAAIAGYNFTVDGGVVNGRITATDYIHAAAMTQEGSRAWDLPQSMILYNWKAKTVHNFSDGDYEFELNGFSDIFAMMIPVNSGWGVIGRDDKYLSPCGCEVLSARDDRLMLSLKENSDCLLYSEHSAVESDDAVIRKEAQNLYRITPNDSGDIVTVISC